MKLNEKLRNIQEEMSKQLPIDILNMFGQSLQELMALKIETHALQVGDLAPNFTLRGTDGQPVSLYNILEHNPVVLSFFRGNWCPFCMAELIHYQEAIINNIVDKATVIAISPQTVRLNLEAAEKNGLEFKILSDQGNKVANQYGLVFTLQENIREIYKNIGADLALFNDDDSYTLPIPATYLINKNRKIEFASVNANYMERADICEIKIKP